MGYLLREEPMTLAEIKAKSASNFVEEVIPVPIQTLLDNGFVDNMDIWEHQLLGDQGILTDVEYTVVGCGMDNEVHLKVSGYAELCGDLLIRR
mgnify:CR=1 FL=1